MAEGGEFEHVDPDINIRFDDEDDDQEVNRTGPFDPYEASTP